jgi:hypothetical protein
MNSLSFLITPKLKKSEFLRFGLFEQEKLDL